ncbi:MAG TPA: uroporphyrinogen decarboxylase family protein [Ignavibacteria bacterium]
MTPRKIFVEYVKGNFDKPFIVSPFLPHYPVIKSVLKKMNLQITNDFIIDEITLSKALNYIPMFMTDLPGLIFDWQVDESRSTKEYKISYINTELGEWIRKDYKNETQWTDEAGAPVKTEKDHFMVIAVCNEIEKKENKIREYFRNFREKVGEDGVIVIGHPHPSWLAYQINPQDIYIHWNDYKSAFLQSMDAIYKASIFIMNIAIEEGIDFMSDSSYGLEMTSPQLFKEMDLPYIKAFADFAHNYNSLFWYHNCGLTRKMIMDGDFNKLGADVIETIAPPPAGDNDLAESRKYIDKNICTKGNIDLYLLRDGNVEDVKKAVINIVNSVKGYKHIISTADAVLTGTPPENFITFIDTANSEIEKI